MHEQSYDTIEFTLAADVADAGTFTVGYPAFRDSGAYALAWRHYIRSNTYGTLYGYVPPIGSQKLSFSFGATNITITNNSGQTLLAQTKLWVSLDRAGGNLDQPVANQFKMAPTTVFEISLGAPDVLDADGVVASQACTASGGLATGINGALAVSSVGIFDVPRNVVAAWTGTAILTVTGYDEYGNLLVEKSASGTSLTGKKAFKRVTAVTTSADITALTVGSGDVLGLPFFLSDLGRVLKEMEDGVAATAGTFVKGVRTTPSATTGDIRGTYDPNSACDGAKAFTLLVALDAPGAAGGAQYAG